MTRKGRPVAKQRLRVVERAEREDVSGPDVAPQLPQPVHVLQTRLGGQMGGVDGSDGRADDDIGLDARLEERLEHSDVDAPEVGSARQHESDHYLRLPLPGPSNPCRQCRCPSSSPRSWWSRSAWWSTPSWPQGSAWMMADVRRGTSWRRQWRASSAMRWAAESGRSPSTLISASAWRRWPIHRTRSSP